MTTAIRIENVSKLYRLGTVGTGTIAHDLNRWWHTIRGKEDPYAKVGQVNDRTKRAASDEKPEASSDSCATPSPLATRHSSLRACGPDYVWALRDINLEVQQGEILGIIGRNGAGKSTLLKLLSRVTAPTTGSIKTTGRIASLLEVGTGFHQEMTGRENIYMNGAILGMRRHEITKRLEEIVEFSGCAKYLDTPVKRYSSGMTVRLGFAVAAHLNPEILVVDEVLAVGDAEFQKKCMGKLDNVAKSGKTVLFVSHNLSAIRQLTSHCVLIEDGRCAFVGDTASAVDRYVRHSIEKANDPSAIGRMKRVDWAGSQEIRVVAAEVQNSTVNRNEPIELRIVIESSIDSEFRIGLTLHSTDGDSIAAGFSQTLASELGSCKTVELQLHNPGLAPGGYCFTLGIFRGRREMLDVVQEVLHFEVGNEDLPEGIVEWNQGWGHIGLSFETRLGNSLASDRYFTFMK
jgi:lipopolysaccharide transport system ATP-binding protein